MIAIRPYTPEDTEAINELALAAFSQYQHQYSDWPEFSARLQQFSLLASSAEILLATYNNAIVGAVAYVGATIDKPTHFPANTPIIRMLVVAPQYRGYGIGKKLTQTCLDCAVRDSAKAIALHTSDIMTVALPMYLRLGFSEYGHAPSINGVGYKVYIKTLQQEPAGDKPWK